MESLEWYPMPSLKFLSAMKVSTHIFTRPAVAGHYVGHVDWFQSEEHEDLEKMKAEIIATLMLPLSLQEYILSLTRCVINQLHNFYGTARNLFEREVPCLFPLKTKEEVLMYVRWTNEGSIDLERTVDRLQSIVDGEGHYLFRHNYKRYLLACSYLLEQPIYTVWANRRFQNCGKHDFSISEMNYQLYQQEKVINLQKEDFCMEAVKNCIAEKNFPGVRTCWQHLSLSCKKQILPELLVQNYYIFALTFLCLPSLDGVTSAEIVRFCLLHCEESELTAHILPYTPEPSCWLLLLWVFWLWPEKSVFQAILKCMFVYLKKDEYFFMLFTMLKIVNSSSNKNKFFKYLWEGSPREYKMELLREEENLISLLTYWFVDNCVTSHLAMILKSYTPDEKRPFLQQHGFKVCATLIAYNLPWKDTVLQECAVCQVNVVKTITEEILLTTTPFISWIKDIGWDGFDRLIIWSGLSSEEAIQLKKQLKTRPEFSYFSLDDCFSLADRRQLSIPV